jgi:hypothetical protein
LKSPPRKKDEFLSNAEKWRRPLGHVRPLVSTFKFFFREIVFFRLKKFWIENSNRWDSNMYSPMYVGVYGRRGKMALASGTGTTGSNPINVWSLFIKQKA